MKRGSKGPGCDYWGRRPESGGYGYGKIVKTLSKRIERARSKAAVKQGKEFSYREAF